MRNLSYKIKLAIIRAALVPLFGRIALSGTGNENECFRYIVPLAVGCTSGFVIGLIKDKWLLLNKKLASNNESLKQEIEDRKKAMDALEIEKNTLESARTKFQELTGLLPICSSCKKIRDDKGYWNQLESYIEKHSDVAFSHGLCPNCIEKTYGSEEWFQEMKNENKK